MRELGHLEEPRVDERILRQIFTTYDGEEWTGWISG